MKFRCTRNLRCCFERQRLLRRLVIRFSITNEPVLYFDTLKTSSMEGAATTVYAQGGRGNSSWCLGR